MEAFYEYLRRANLEVKPHQIAGLDWCLNAERNGTLVEDKLVRGGFLADEMGLGKTIQIIGTCLCNLRRRTLIVLPRALIEQWVSVFRETLGHEPILFHGYHKQGVTMEELRQAPFVITSYGMIGRECLIHKVEWERVIFDEAHHLRNKRTGVYQGAKRLHANIRWLVTATPVQNKMADFRALCSQLDVSGKDVASCKKLMLRRTKKESGVMLPPIRKHLNSVRWGDANETVLAERYHNNKEQLSIVRILRARQMCVLPALIDSSHTTTSKLDEVVDRIKKNANNGRSKLVFCHFRGEIDALKSRLESNQRVTTFDGRVKPSKRSEILREPTDVLLCQIQTCCEGLNLQQFEEVYFVSPHWNPAVEDQAIARCHRIGQKKPVDVYRFSMEKLGEETNSMDQYVQDVQIDKRTLAKEVIS